MVASTNSNRSIEEICSAASMPIWFQLYVDDDRGVTRALIERAEAAGCKTMVITVDNPLAFARNREERVSAQMPKLPFPNLGLDASARRARPLAEALQLERPRVDSIVRKDTDCAEGNFEPRRC